MTKRRQHGQGRAYSAALLCVLALALFATRFADAQAAATRNATPKSKTAPQPEAPKMPTVAGTPIDRVVAIVNGDLILDSDIDEELRFQALQPFRTPGNTNTEFTREKAIERLINRDLILQQAKLQPESAVSDEDVEKDLGNLRKNLPACKEYHCETSAGWTKFLASNGFTPELMRTRWRQRMQVLSFIEDRFRMGINISQADIKDYYEKTFIPEFAKQNAKAPALDAVSDRIQEVLLQQRVSTLLNDWLRSLRAQGGVIVLHPGEDAP